jgi:hypothetical protein
MKQPDFIVQDVYNEIDKLFIQVLRLSCALQEFKFPPKYLGYLRGHLWGALPVLS